MAGLEKEEAQLATTEEDKCQEDRGDDEALRWQGGGGHGREAGIQPDETNQGGNEQETKEQALAEHRGIIRGASGRSKGLRQGLRFPLSARRGHLFGNSRFRRRGGV